MTDVLRELQTELTRIAIFWAALEVIAFLGAMGVLYLVVRAAVRDGINDSRLGARTTPLHAEVRRKHAAGELDEIRID